MHARVSSLSLGTLLVTLAIPCLAAPATFADIVLADSPIAYWRLGEAAGSVVAADAAADQDGTYALLGVAPGEPGINGGDTGVQFDGGRVSVPNDPALGPDLITMEALLRWDGPNGFQQRILEKSFFAGGEQASYGLNVLDDGSLRVEIRAGGGPSSHTAPAALTAGSGAHVVGAFDGSLVSIYLNGALLLSEAAAFPGDLQDGVNALGIGNQVERDRPFRGLLDEVALYDYALSAQQVEQHFQALNPVPEPASAGLLGAALILLLIAAPRGKRRSA
jgi:hypothetical protein